MERTDSKNSLWIGIILIFIGGFYLLDNFNLIPRFIPYWIFSWKMVFVLIGTVMLMTGRNAGLIFLIIGGVFLVPEIIHQRIYFRDWWPVILVAIGFSLLVRSRREPPSIRGGEEDMSRDDVINDTSIFGGGSKVVNTQNFRGGKITAMFGGSEIYFQESKTGQTPAVIDVFILFGGTTLHVPSNWNVKNEVTSILGGFTDSRRRLAETEDASTNQLIVKGFVMFGGGDIKTA